MTAVAPARRAAPADVSVAIDPERRHLAERRWNARVAAELPAGTTAPPSGLVHLLRAGAALATAVGTRMSHAAGRPVTLQLDPLAFADLAWTPPQGAQTGAAIADWAHRGFHRCRDGGSVSLALADDEQRAMVERAIGPIVAGAPLPGRAPEIAAWLQEWGLMCLPAQHAPAATARAAPPDSEAMARSGPLIASMDSGLDEVSSGFDERAAARDHAPPLLAVGAPLSRDRFVTLGSLIAGPFAGVLLASAGATVHHLTHPARPPIDFGGPPVAVERVDLTGAAGRRRLLTLLDDAAALIENFRPRVLDNLSLRPLPLRRPPAHIALPGFASGSARANWRSVGFQLEACAGLGQMPSVDAPGAVPASGVPLVSDLAAALLGAALAITLPRGRSVEPAQYDALRLGRPKP